MLCEETTLITSLGDSVVLTHMEIGERLGNL